MTQVDLHTRFDQVSAQEWQQLLGACDDTTVFQQRAWLQAWWDCLRRPDWQLHLLAARRAGELVGLAPLYERPGRLGRRELRLLGEGQADYLLFPVHREVRAALDALLAAIARHLEGGCDAVLTDVAEASLLQAALQQRITQQGGDRPLALHRTQRTPCPRLALDAQGTALARVLRKQSLRRHARALAARGPLAIAHHGTAAAILPLLPAFFGLHIDRWQDTVTPSQFTDRNCRQLYETLVGALPDGSVWLTTVHVGPQLAAAHLGFASGDALLWYIPAHERALQRHGPGEVLLQAVLQQAQALGMAVLDFARGDEAYKRRFADHTAWTSGYEWIGNSWAQRSRQRLRLVLRQLRGRRIQQ